MYLLIIAREVVRKINSFTHDPRSNSQAPETYVIRHGCWLKEFDDLESIYFPGNLFHLHF